MIIDNNKNKKSVLRIERFHSFPRYKAAADLQFRETLKSINIYSDYIDESLPEYLISDKSYVYIMKSILNVVDFPENLIDISVLHKRYRDFSNSRNSLEFTIDQLFDEGWLVKCGNEWIHNCSPNKYKELSFSSNEREKEIIEFLNTLSDIDIFDIGLAFDSEKNSQLLNELSTSVDELLKVGILFRENSYEEKSDSKSDVNEKYSKLYISSHTKIWETLGSIVLSSLLNEKIRDDHNYFSKWLCYCRYLNHIYFPEKYVENKEALYSYCLSIISEIHGTDEIENNILSRALWFSHNNKDHIISIPTKPQLREEFFEQGIDFFHDVKFLSYFSYTIIGTAVGMCSRLYSHVPMDIRNGLLKVLSDPYFIILNYNKGYLDNADLEIDGIKNEKLSYQSLVSIYGKLQQRASYRNNEIYNIEKFAGELWDVIYNELSNGRIIDSFVEIIAYLGIACDFNMPGRGYGNNKISLTFFLFFLRKYTEELGWYESVDNKIREYIETSINSASRDVEIIQYLKVLFAFLSERNTQSTFIEEWINISLVQLLKQYKRSVKEKYNISSIHLHFFNGIIEINIPVEGTNNIIKEYLSTAKDILEVAKEITGDIYTDKVNRRWGAYVGVYLLSSAIVASQKYGKRKANSSKELDLLIDSIIFFQKKDRIFSRENILLYDAEGILNCCVSTITYLGDVQKKKFVVHACDELEIIDLITWTVYISDNDIKKDFIESAVGGVSAEKADEVAKMVTDSVAMTVYFADIVNLIIWYKDEFGDKCHIIQGLIYIAEAILNRYIEWAKGVSRCREDIIKRTSSWIESAKNQIKYISGETDALKKSDSNFYRGLFYIDSDNIEDVEESVRIFEKLYRSTGSISSGINYMSAITRMIGFRVDCEDGSESRKIEEDELSLLQKVRLVYDEIVLRTDNGVYTPGPGFYYTILLAYYLEKKYEEFWHIYKTVPEDFVLYPSITELAVRVYIIEKRKDEAHNLYKNCKKKYAVGRNLDEIKSIIDSEDTEHPLSRIMHKEMDVIHRPSLDEIRRVLDYLHSASGDDIMKVLCKRPYADHEILERMGIDDLHGGDEKLLVLEMLLSAAINLEEYSRSMLWEWKQKVQIPDENTFNRTIKMLFNRREKRFLGYSVGDQSQAGKPENRLHIDRPLEVLEDEELENANDIALKDIKKPGMGELDLQVERGEECICIIEGIKVLKKFENNKNEKKRIVSHIKKVDGYDTKRANLYALMVYSSNQDGDYSEMYQQYIRLLQSIKNRNDNDLEDCHVIDVIPDVDPKALGIDSKFNNLCITIHRNPQIHKSDGKIIMYHLFLDVCQ